MTNTTTREVVRLQSDLYLKLEQKLSRTIVTTDTTPITAAYALGVEAVLKELRNGFVVKEA